MEEKIIDIDTKQSDDFDVEIEKYEDINIEDEYIYTVDTTVDYSVVEVDVPEEIEIDLEESIGWVGGDSTKHYSLAGRDEPDQHPIKSIIGLRDELDKIEALQTVYSDKYGIANYYADTIRQCEPFKPCALRSTPSWM